MLADTTFWPDFWANFWADLIVGIVIAGLISWVLSKARKVEARMCVRTERIDQSSLQLRFSIWNTGKISFRRDEIFWHALIDKKLKPQTPSDGATDEVIADERRFVHVKGMLSSPVFPSRHTECFSVKVQADNVASGDLLYYLSTAHGMFPRSMTINREDKIDLKTIGHVHVGITDR